MSQPSHSLWTDLRMAFLLWTIRGLCFQFRESLCSDVRRLKVVIQATPAVGFKAEGAGYLILRARKLCRECRLSTYHSNKIQCHVRLRLRRSCRPLPFASQHCLSICLVSIRCERISKVPQPKPLLWLLEFSIHGPIYVWQTVRDASGTPSKAFGHQNWP